MWIPDAVLDHVSGVVEEPDLALTKYRLARPLGRGGMGAVYAVTDGELGREVALKVSSATDGSGELTSRLRREAEIIAQLEHPGIVPVHDVGVLPDGRVFYVMKLVRGERLDRWRKANADRRAALRLFQRICEAVGFAHSRGTIHRDLKPENLMIGPFGEALVMDWGIAKSLSNDASESEGTVVGTPGFMSPEQARGDLAAIDARSDVYALGAVLYFLLVQRAPSEGTLDADVPKPLVSICERAMAERAADRYDSALDLSTEIGRFLEGAPVLAHHEGPIERALRFASRNRVILSLLGAYLLLRLVLLAFSR